MTHFDCGCETDGSARCLEHWLRPCHNDMLTPEDFEEWERECPPCRLSRLRSVSLSPKATPTRRNT